MERGEYIDSVRGIKSLELRASGCELSAVSGEFERAK
jgi:hypothetical protein